MTDQRIVKLQERTLSLSQAVIQITVNDSETMKKANDFLVNIKTLRKEVSETFNPIIEKAHLTHKEAVAQKKRHEEPLKEAEQILKLRVSGYLAELEKKRREMERLLKEEEERIEREKAENLKKAQEAIESGDTKTATELIEKSESVLPTVEVPREEPLPEDTQIRKIWKWEVTDLNAVPREFLVPDNAKITKEVRALKEKAQISGIRIYQESSVAVRPTG